MILIFIPSTMTIIPGSWTVLFPGKGYVLGVQIILQWIHREKHSSYPLSKKHIVGGSVTWVLWASHTSPSSLPSWTAREGKAELHKTCKTLHDNSQILITPVFNSWGLSCVTHAASGISCSSPSSTTSGGSPANWSTEPKNTGGGC